MMVLQAGFGGGDIPVRFRCAEFFVPASSLTLVSPAVYDVIVIGRLSELLVVGAICRVCLLFTHRHVPVVVRP